MNPPKTKHIEKSNFDQESLDIQKTISIWTKQTSRWTRILAYLTGSLALFTAGVLYYNTVWIGMAKDQLTASVRPEVEITEFHDTLRIYNVGLPRISDLTIYEVLYLGDTAFNLQSRCVPNWPSFKHGRLDPGDSIRIPMKDILHTNVFMIAQPKQTVFIALTLLYRRDVDKKRYLIVRPYSITDEKNYFRLFHQEGIGTSMPLIKNVDIAIPMEDWERRFFSIKD